MKNKVIKAGFWYTIGNLMIKGIGFISIPIFTRILSLDEYGIYNSYIAYESILFVIIGLALHSSIKNAKYTYKDNFDNYCSSVLVLGLISLVFFLIIGNIFYSSIFYHLGFTRLILNLLIIQSYCASLITFFNNKLSLDYKYKTFLKVSFFNVFGNISLSIVLIYTLFHGNALLGRIAGTVIPMIIIGIYILSTFFKKEKPQYNKDYWKYGLEYSLPIIPHGVSQVLLSQFDRIMVQKIISSSAAGIYSFSYNLGLITQTIATSLDTAYSTWFYEQMNLKKYDLIKSKANSYIKIFTIIVILIMLGSPEIMKIMAPSTYWGAIYCVFPIILSTYFMFLYSLIVQIEYFHKKTTYIALGTLCAAIVNIILNLIFIPKYGYVAAAYTTLFSYILYFIFHYVLAHKIIKFHLYDFKYICLSCISVFIIAVLSLYFIDNIMIRIFIAFVIIIYTFNFVKNFIKDSKII